VGEHLVGVNDNHRETDRRVVERERERPAQRPGTALAAPRPGALDESEGKLEIVLALEEAEAAGLLAVGRVVAAVDLTGDAAARSSSARR
jgi:hypothetical protein